MVSSFGVSIVLLLMHKNGGTLSTHKALLITIAVTTVCWVDRLSRPADRPADADRVLPEGATVRPRLDAHPQGGRHFPRGGEATGQNIPLALLGWVAGCTVIWSALFTVGNFLYGRTNYALMLLAVFIVSGLVLLRVVNRVWDASKARE